jgi:3-hydroxyacyl-[acyl-carrier-protein] dehydratase
LLLNDLYNIQSITESENQVQVEVLLQADHTIFKGHFPGQPVLPGVCMMEMITEIMEEHLKKSFRISSAPLIKFLLMIDPRKDPLIYFEIIYQTLPGTTTANGKIYSGLQIFMKFQMNLAEAMGS